MIILKVTIFFSCVVFLSFFIKMATGSRCWRAICCCLPRTDVSVQTVNCLRTGLSVSDATQRKNGFQHAAAVLEPDDVRKQRFSWSYCFKTFLANRHGGGHSVQFSYSVELLVFTFKHRERNKA